MATDRFQVSVNESYEFEFSAEETEQLDQLQQTAGDFHVLFNRKSYSPQLIDSDFDKRRFRVQLKGKLYDVSIATPLDQLIDKMGLSLGNESFDDTVLAPMPGVILEVLAAAGDSVKKGDFLCVLEAMKMENALTAPRDGVIKSVNIQQGETVDKGKLLIEFETL